jgi:monofunctional glycosyltransferase
MPAEVRGAILQKGIIPNVSTGICPLPRSVVSWNLPTPAARTKKISRKPGRTRHLWRYLLLVACGFVFAFYATVGFTLVILRWVNPPTTAVQVERRIQSWFGGGRSTRNPYRKRYAFVPLGEISLNFQHAVIAAEDTRFYQHHGFDWRQVEIAATEDIKGKRFRGGSTIDQQLVKNLFLTTSRSFVRKGVETTIVPFAEMILGKKRILELYLNVVEWGPGVYGAQAAAEYHYHIPAARIIRDQGARLAALLPAPRRRKPAAMGIYAARIEERMRQMGW